jgi:negative regulator of sigma E activity
MSQLKGSVQISRANYDFVFLRQQNFRDVPEYVFAIFPKRKDRYLLRGQIWVDGSNQLSYVPKLLEATLVLYHKK